MDIPKHLPSTPLLEDIARVLEEDYAYIRSVIRDHYGDYPLTVFNYDTPDAPHVEPDVTDRLRQAIHSFIQNAEQMHLAGAVFSEELTRDLAAWREH